MVSVLAVGVVGLPLLASALVAVALRGARPSTAHRVALTATGLTALCALALLPHAGDGSAITVEWLPGAGPMALTTSATGLYPVLVTVWGAFLVLLGTTSRGGKYPPLSGAVMLLALAATNVAFLTDHFLARYVALEIVALCIALAPLVSPPISPTLGGEDGGGEGIRLSWSSYLLLRLGDAGLLTGILLLKDASGTLSIGPALEFALSSVEGASGALDATRLGWVVAGFILAVWVKLGGWPFHLWSQPGRRLSLASHAWLYATVMPSLGAYLLYRVTPLLALAGPLRTAALWLGAGGAALAALIALTREDLRGALVYIGAAQGGLALFVAASGVKTAVWLGLLALTPLRLLLFLAVDAAQHSDSPTRRRVAASLFALGGLALAAFGLLTTWWAREAGAPLDALLVAEAAVALTGVWAMHAAWRPLLDPKGLGKPSGSSVHWTQWMTVWLFGIVVLAGGLAFGPLARHLAAVSHMTLPTMPTFPALLHYAATAPALLVVMVLALVVWRFQRRSRWGPLVPAQPAEEVYDLKEGLAKAAQVLHAIIEVGIAEQVITLVVRTVVDGARTTYLVVEQKGLEGLLSRAAQSVMDAARMGYNVVEQGSLEGLLRRAVGAVLVLGRGLQRWHTGRLRRNLLWAVVSLALMVLMLVLYD